MKKHIKIQSLQIRKQPQVTNPIKIQSLQNIRQPQMITSIKIQSLHIIRQPQVAKFWKSKPTTLQIKKRLLQLTTKPNDIREAMALKKVWEIYG